MMESVFIKILNMSLTAGYLVLALIILRFLLKKAPRWITCVLWAFVAVRLVCPFSFESAVSHLPSTEVIPEGILLAAKPEINSGISSVNQSLNPIISDIFAPSPSASANPLQILAFFAAVVWLVGIAVMLIYAAVSYMRLHFKVREGVCLRDNIFMCDHVPTPFILGVFRPRIYLPSSLSEEDMEYVIAHENAHLRRRDHIWKPLGYLLLSVHWFNPLLWIAYIMLCRDIEFACDEKVIREMGTQIKQSYSSALINCSVRRRTISVCPLAFGEVGVKGRVKKVLNYKKPAFWIIIVAVVLTVVFGVCYLTDPLNNDTNIDDQTRAFLDMQIAEYYKTERTADNFVCVDYDVLKKEETKSEITLYMQVLYEEYSFDTELRAENGVHAPTVITAQKTDDGYKLREYWTPRDGQYYEDDVRYKFPKSVCNDVLGNSGFIARASGRCHAKAQKYFGLTPSTGGPVNGPGVIGEGADVFSAIRAGFLARGFMCREVDAYSWVTGLRGEMRNLDVHGETLNLYVYESPEVAAEDAGRISLDGCSITRADGDEMQNISIGWSYAPHWYLCRDTIVCYVGSYSDILWVLRDLCGEPFAGEGASFPHGEQVAAYTFGCEDEDMILAANVFLYDSGEFEFIFSPVSSYIGFGTYTRDADRLTLRTDDGANSYVFRMEDDNLVLVAFSGSDWYSGFEVGSVFRKVPLK